MVRFIESAHGGQANRLLQAVLADLRDPVCIAGCRALGLIDKVVTGPLWRKLSESSVSVLEMGSVYTEMKAMFDSWSGDSHALIEGSATLKEASVMHFDEVWNALIESNATDVMTQELLQLLFAAFSVTTQRMLLDHLPGGKYHVVADTVMVQETASVPTTNVAPERDFAILDRLMQEKPKASHVALESMILYSHNKTSSWLEKQSYEEKEKLLRTAQTLAPTIRAKFKARRQEIEVRREKALMKKQEDIARKQLQTVRERERITKEIEQLGGLWINRAKVENGLKPLKKTAKMKAPKLQINFRRKVLGQSHPDKSFFLFSHNRKQHSVDQLKKNLYQLLAVGEENPTISIEDVVQQPELLVGCRVKHRFETDRELVWYERTVLQMNSETQEFQVAYDNEDDICCFPLLDDIASGDLLISSM